MWMPGPERLNQRLIPFPLWIHGETQGNQVSGEETGKFVFKE